jgi:threonine dehydrogenase-like Zn-dependent dehydrogenase
VVLVQAPKDVAPGKLLALADIATTAWHGCELAEVGKGYTVGVWGCEPIGLSIQKLSVFRGDSKVYAIDPDSVRLKIAQSIGCNPINVTEPKISRTTSSSMSHMDWTRPSRRAGLEVRQVGNIEQ